MWPDRVSNPGPPCYESGALPIALRGPAAWRSNASITADLDRGSPLIVLFHSMLTSQMTAAC